MSAGLRVASLLWEVPKVMLKSEVLEIRNVDGSLHIERMGPADGLMGRAPSQRQGNRGVTVFALKHVSW
jgi:hypothetical protein